MSEKSLDTLAYEKAMKCVKEAFRSAPVMDGGMSPEGVFFNIAGLLRQEFGYRGPEPKLPKLNVMHGDEP